MLTATLINPARLNSHGRIWERGVPHSVDLSTARQLNDNPRFEVQGLFETLDALASGKTLEDLGVQATPPASETELETSANEDLAQRIRDAVGDLDVDDDDSFLDNGQPNPVAISLALGEDVTAEQILDATNVNPKGQLDADTKPSKGTKTIRVARSKPARSDDETAIEV